MLTNVTHTLEQIPAYKSKRFLLAVSGGMDSMCLLEVFNELKLSFSVAHCNYNLRGPDSDLDQELVEKSCKKKDIKCFIKQFDTKKIQEETGGSIQMVARDLRYNWFKDIVSQNQFDYIVTAHHLNDSIETFFINLSRGTGIKGLTGISFKNKQVIRPFINVTNESITTYVKENNIEYREDASNASLKYKRNIVRHELLPILKKLNPSFVNTMQKNMDILNDTESYIHQNIATKLRKNIVSTKGDFSEISIKELLKLNFPKIYLLQFLEPFGFNSSQVNDVLKSIKNTGSQFYSGSHKLLIDRENLVLKEIKQTPSRSIIIKKLPFSVTYPVNLTLTKEDLLSNYKEIEKNIALLDYNKIDFPITIRKWQINDKFTPLGMKGSKKISDYLIDEKIDLFEKEETYILESNGSIAWLIGHRISDKFKITANTEQIVQITFKA